MPKRLVQIRTRRQYGTAIGSDTRDDHKWRGGDRVALYNIAPGQWPWLLHRFHDGADEIDTVRWGYESPADTRPREVVRADWAMNARYYHHMCRDGRAIVPLDGWFEFAGGGSEPWFVRLRPGQTMLAAAITNFRPYKSGPPGTGFCLVSAGEPGFADPADLRPVILTPEGARLWMEPSISPDEAHAALGGKALAPSAFHAYRVGQHVLSTDAGGEDLIAPV